jgi:hypothetical protein
MSESDLDQPGKPLDGKTVNADGTWSPFEIPQTKRDNCASAAAEAGGLDKVTPELLAKWQVTKAEYAEFAMNHVKALNAMETQRRYYEIMLPEFPPGPPDRDEYIRLLKQLMPDDWQKHVPPD